LRAANRRYQAMHPFGVRNQSQNQRGFGFNIPTALKGWVGLAPQGRGALHIIIIYYYYLTLTSTAKFSYGRQKIPLWAKISRENIHLYACLPSLSSKIPNF
jgi:hypothetical protein